MNLINVEGLDRVTLLSEFTSDHSATGSARRLHHIERWFTSMGLQVTHQAVNENKDAALGRRGRLQAVRNFVRMATVTVPNSNSLTVVAGLGVPHMLKVANGMARSRRVIFDACDSWSLQARYRARTSPMGVVIPIWGGLVQAQAKGIGVSYISKRDADADAALNRRAEVFVIPPVAPLELADLAPVQFPLERIVILGDFNSYHNSRGLRIIARALELLPSETAIRFEAFGPNPPPAFMPIKYKGWAPNLASIYEGNTGVLVTNVVGSGVPNKILEGIASGRPMFAHSAIAERFPEANIFRFDTPLELASLLRTSGADPGVIH